MADLMDLPWPMPQQPLGNQPGLFDTDEAAEDRYQREVEAAETDVDSFADWLYSQCLGAKPAHVRTGYVPRDPVSFNSYVESLDVAQLVGLMLQWPSHGSAVAKVLREKWLAVRGL